MLTRLIFSPVSMSLIPMPPDTDLLILLHDVARLMRTTADRRARAHGMTRAQWMILFRLRRQDALTQRELAEILEVEPITVGRLVDRLARIIHRGWRAWCNLLIGLRIRLRHLNPADFGAHARQA